MWEPYKKGFKAYLQLEKSLSDNSVEAYLRDIEKLTQYLLQVNSMKNPSDITLKDLQQFCKMDHRTGHDGYIAGENHFRYKIIL